MGDGPHSQVDDPAGESERPGRLLLLARIAVDVRPLRASKDFRRLWFGTGISAIGSQVTIVAIPFQVYELTGSTLLVGLLGAERDDPAARPRGPAHRGDRGRGRRLNLSRVAGPAAAGLLIGVIGLAGAYTVDLASFAASLVAIWLLPSVPPAGEVDRPGLRSVVEGLRYVRTQPPLLGIFLVDANAMIFGMPSALFPAFAEELGGGAQTVGLLYSAPYAGALAASLLSGWVGHVRRTGLGVVVAAGLWGVAIAFAGLADAVWLALLLLAAAGAADFISAVLRSTMLLAATPDAMRGRLSGIELAQVAGAPALGNVEAGVVASLTRVRFSVVSGGVACVVGTIAIALALPALLRFDARQARA